MFVNYQPIFDVLFGGVFLLLMLRLQFQWLRLRFSNGFVQFVYWITTPVLRPLEKIIPRYGNISLACLSLMILVLLAWAFVLTRGFHVIAPILALSFGLKILYWQLVVVCFIYALASLLQAPRTDFSEVISAFVYPMVSPIRRRLPMRGPVDWSLLIAMILLSLIYNVLEYGLRQLAILVGS
jgi:YggT family protein